MMKDGITAIDKVIGRYGYKLIDETFYGAYYEKQEPQGFTHVIGVLHKKNGKHIIQSFDKQTWKIGAYHYINEGCGVEVSMLLFLWLKEKQLCVRYHWSRKGVTNEI